MSKQRHSPVVRRQLIIEAARKAIMREGMRHTSLRDIAAQAEVSLGTVTYHFKSVYEIIGAAALQEAELFYTPLVEAVRDEPDPKAALLALIDPLFDGAEETAAHWRLWLEYWNASSTRPGLAEEDYGRLRIWQTCFEETIKRGIADGEFAAGVDPAEVALKVAAFSDGIATQISMNPAGLSHVTAKQWMRQLLTAELGTDFSG
ncbi:TetR/AcrR family transcriptional regulator [Arthrobacter castelli]|uniref:TetR/AcrR family transcriptional regulator n=1 Tax=Arthrobacter castelli TaxID=271431 RepID=UPI00047A6261|nr:TetR family transcriptional regulator C-terminal domain-containing protein [Arthrobacter castelli]